MTRILAVGMSNTDLVCRTPRLPVAGETVAGTSFSTFAGGKGANQAVAAARGGATVTFCGATGDDAYGHARRNDLLAEGIDVSHLHEIQGVPSGIALIVVSDSGENQIVTVAGANGQVDPARASRAVAETAPDLVLMTWELAPATCSGVMSSVSASVPVVLNIAPFHDSVASVFPNDDLVIICNEIEAEQLLGESVDAGSAEEAARLIVNRGCRAAIITLGAKGAAGASATEAWSVVPPSVRVVDTTGSGDAFCGAFAAWLADGSTLLQATEAGVHAGAIATTVHGAQPSIPVREQILASLGSGTVSSVPDDCR